MAKVTVLMKVEIEYNRKQFSEQDMIDGLEEGMRQNFADDIDCLDVVAAVCDNKDINENTVFAANNLLAVTEGFVHCLSHIQTNNVPDILMKRAKDVIKAAKTSNK